MYGWNNKVIALSSTHSIAIMQPMDIVPRPGRKNNASRAAGALVSLGKLANDNGVLREALKFYKKMSQDRAKRQQQQKPVKKQTVDQRSVKTAAPTSFGISSNDVVRSVVVRSTPTMSRFTGVSYLGTVTTGPNVSSYPTVALFTSSNPVTFQDRLQIQASTYDKFVYNSVKLKYVPAVGTNTSGKVAIAIDRDYTDPPQTVNWGQCISYESVASGTVWSEHMCSMRRDPSEKRSYFTNFASGTDVRETEQFKFYAYTQGVPANTFCGDLYLEYDLELISPVYAPSELSQISENSSTVISSGAITSSAAGQTWTVNPLPVDDNTRAIYEVVVNGQPNTAGIQFGSLAGSAAYAPAFQGSYRLWCRPINNGTARQYFIYTDLTAAMTGGQPLYQTAALGGTLFASTQVIFRRITYPSVGE